MPRTRACPSCGQMCLLGGFAFHVKQCGHKMMQIETACPYCDKMYPQMELASHVGACPQNRNRTRTNARDRRNAGRAPINGMGRAGGVGQAINGGKPSQYGTVQQRRQPQPEGSAGGPDRIETMSVKELRAHITAAGLSHADCFEKPELKARAREAGPVGGGSGGGGGGKAGYEPAPSRSSEPIKEFPSDGAGVGLVPCGHCGRSFAPDRVGKHMGICGKQKKKRRGFDSASQRGRGQEIFTRVTPRGKGGAGKGADGGNRHARVDYGLPSEAKLMSKWRQEHREFQNVIRSIKGKAPMRSEYASPGGGGNNGGSEPRGAGGPPDTSGPLHFVPCPHCQRTFTLMASSRHIPSCGNSHARPKPPPAMRGYVMAGAGGRSRAGWNSGPGGGGGGSSRASAGWQRQRTGEGGRPLTGGPMMGGRSARFPSGGASGGGGYNTLEQQRMSQTAAASAFAAAGATALYGLHESHRPASSGNGIAGRDRPPSGGGFRSNGGGRPGGGGRGGGGGGGGGGGRGGFANGYQMGQGPVSIDPGGGGGGFVPMLSTGNRATQVRGGANTRWPSVHQ